MVEDGPRSSPVNDVTTTEYSQSGYLTKVTNGMGHETRYENHNGRGQPGRIIDANNVITDITYTARGWIDIITQDVNGENAVTDFDYDDVGQLESVTLADGVNMTFEFDDGHRLRATQNGLSERIEYALDAAGNQDYISYWDSQGNEVQSIDYDFDGLSRLWKEIGSYGQQSNV